GIHADSRIRDISHGLRNEHRPAHPVRDTIGQARSADVRYDAHLPASRHNNSVVDLLPFLEAESGTGVGNRTSFELTRGVIEDADIFSPVLADVRAHSVHIEAICEQP